MSYGEFNGTDVPQSIDLQTEKVTAVFKKVATFNIDFASRDADRTHQNAFKSCDSNFVHKTVEIK